LPSENIHRCVVNVVNVVVGTSDRPHSLTNHQIDARNTEPIQVWVHAESARQNDKICTLRHKRRTRSCQGSITPHPILDAIQRPWTWSIDSDTDKSTQGT